MQERAENPFSLAELQLATRNHGMPLEALRYPVTPVGLHYLLIHYDIPAVDEAAWRLELGGRVREPRSLSLEEIRSRPAVTMPVTFECAGNGRARLDPRPVSQPWLVEAVGTAEWRGTRLRPILEEAGLLENTVEIVFTGLDRGVEGGVEQPFERSLPLEDALGDDVILAYEVNGAPLPPQHGFPLRLVVPGWYGMANVKWLKSITAVAEPFTGYQNATSYRIRRDEDDPGVPLGRMQPRALMVPPGIPEFMSRDRYVSAGPQTIEGKAWSGCARIAGVEVSTDGGGEWTAADLGEPVGDAAWRPWTFEWTPPRAGEYELACRAIDDAGNEQPSEAPWNYKGYANNEVQRVRVVVDGA
jgi:DMSO/TMAO reductase YedYZ molybdopterin-dependent catalytic subunit